MRFNRRALLKFGAATVTAPVVARLPIPATELWGFSPAMSALPDLRKLQEEMFLNGVRHRVVTELALAPNGRVVAFRGIPITVGG